MNLNEMYQKMGIDNDVYTYGQKIAEELKERFAAIDETAEYNQLKVLHAMQKNRVSDIHFAATSGYGYNDLGRDTLEDVYADTFHAEAGLVRPADHLRVLTLWQWLWLPTCVLGMNFWRFQENPMIRWKKSLEYVPVTEVLQNTESPISRWI